MFTTVDLGVVAGAVEQEKREMAAATMATAFGKRIAVEVIERDGARADVALNGRRFVTTWKSLSFDAAPLPEQYEQPVDLEAGLYEQDGTVFKVQISKTSGKAYAKRLIVIGGKRMMTDGEKANLEYEYAPGAVKTLRPEDRMDLEAAKRFGIEYGFCVRCGAFLKDADSVEAGIGPVCRKAFA